MKLLEQIMNFVAPAKKPEIPIIAVRAETHVMMSWQVDGHSFVYSFDANNSESVAEDISRSAYQGCFSVEHGKKAWRFVRRNFRKPQFQGRVQCYYEPGARVIG